ncbi:DUF262 and DUF1524 domain-containing protein [Sulfitobacter guttiformis]|uniref:Uncharacterized protein with ParB-like and HNH nuclease domain n=1 Tax=Sulfitobacter guttiformis TaxID=74349 RepID=A0A420DTH3_9RHOB|nr:DUF262 and DUF1524 domain-containing protein [Sulfitobacter guttiformis]KIN71144.1 DUF1524 multi-domain protein [Sulfitobacter guttiformis KCTC 32187]RKE97621.1 uncharacterized protein with ParB-like and HNH nuclease domain [Sulfitobacter guttiformis]
MKATHAHLLKFINSATQFVIPIYQRTYSWTEKECRQLWNDVRRAGNTDHIPVHFLGSVVYVEESLSNASAGAPLLVIDGQQRLTSATLLLAALARKVGEDEPVDGFSAKKIRNRYLIDPDETGERQFKLLLSKTDRTTLNALVRGDELPEPKSKRISENFDLFARWLDQDKDAVTDICTGLSKLMIVDVALSRDHDNPQLIFESMNSTGRKLSQADLIRNFVLMGLEPELQTRLYEQYWRRMEEGFGQSAYASHFDGFMRHYLTVVTGSIPRLDDVYEAYKAYAQEQLATGRNIEDLVREVWEYSRYFGAMVLGQEKDPHLSLGFNDLRELKVDVAYPFLLEVYGDFKAEKLSAIEFVEIIRLVEAYVFRRAICAVPTNSMNKTFATFGRSINKDAYLESVKAQFLILKSYRRFPVNDEFIARIQDRDLYNFRSRGYWLRKFENFGRKERVHVDDYTIEHIMPQNENMPQTWRDALGENWAEIQAKWLHTLGNLTLTAYNSEYSDKSFEHKRDMEGGFKDSPLRVSQGLAQVEAWDESAIKARAAKMAKRAAEVWCMPALPEAILSGYRKPASIASEYSIDDHPHLVSGEISGLFADFRREVKALDPCVTEHFLKLYVAYKAETNFVDVIPQAKSLLVSLKIGVDELTDSREMARDVSDLGRWGNGRTEVKLSDLADLPYVLGLVRQALDLQLGSEDAA